jgi:hypothetical protein
MRKVVFLGALALGALIYACKHEIPRNVPPPVGGPGGGSGGGNTGPTCSPDTVYFVQRVLPIFLSNCAMSGCHDAITRQDGVVLTDYASIMSTGDVRPGNPNGSEIWEKITETDPSERMPPPPRSALPADQKELIRTWILQGARNNSCASASCDSTNVTYTATIKPIVSLKCQGCHSGSTPQGGIDLSTYAGVKAKVTDGRLFGAVNHLPGFSPMPKNGAKLSTCELAQIKKWIDAGALNN